MSDGMIVVGFLICVAAGYFTQPYWHYLLRIRLPRFHDTGTHLNIQFRPVEELLMCDGCYEPVGRSGSVGYGYGSLRMRSLCHECNAQRTLTEW